MSDKNTLEHDLRETLRACVPALNRIRQFELDPVLDRRMSELGENKESLTPEEHGELMALVAFARQRTVEKLEAELALKRIEMGLEG